MDGGGNIRITDRKKDMFIVGGFNAYPAEIENVLLAHPDIAQVAVVGVPDERLGEIGIAFVIPRPGGTVDPDEVIAWSRDQMANFKVPRRVEVVDELPRPTPAARSSSTSCGSEWRPPDRIDQTSSLSTRAAFSAGTSARPRP